MRTCFVIRYQSNRIVFALEYKLFDGLAFVIGNLHRFAAFGNVIVTDKVKVFLGHHNAVGVKQRAFGKRIFARARAVSHLDRVVVYGEGNRIIAYEVGLFGNNDLIRRSLEYRVYCGVTYEIKGEFGI